MKIQLAITKDNNDIIQVGSFDITDKQNILQYFMDIYELKDIQELLVFILKYIRNVSKNHYKEEKEKQIDTQEYDDFIKDEEEKENLE